MLNNHKDILDSFNSIEDDSLTFYQNLILGQQAYVTMLYSYLFSTVSQDSKRCGQLVQKISKETLLCDYLQQLGMQDIWDSNEYGISHKIRQSYVVLGMHYQKNGYDSIFSHFKLSIKDFIDDFLLLPITNYTHLLESYAWNTHHLKISYTTKIENKFSDKDIVFRATASFLDKTYYAFGYSKKHAIEKLAYLIVNEAIPRKTVMDLAASQNYLPIEKNILEFDTMDYKENEDRVRKFAEKYGVDFLLMRFSLLTRSHMGENVWETLGIKPTEYLRTKVSFLKRGLIDLGQELLLLQILDYNLRNNNLSAIDLSSLDLMVLNISSKDIHQQLTKILRIDDFSQKLFSSMDVPVNDMLTSKDKEQIGYSIISAFFISNFAPDKKFLQYFNSLFETFYSENGVNIEIDYRFALIAYLSAFNIKVQTNHHEAGNGIFHAEITLGDSANAPTYICENESMRFAKKEVWHKAYESIVVAVKKFFSSPDVNCSDESLSFFVKSVVRSHNSNQAFYSGFGILNAKNHTMINTYSCSKIMYKIKNIINDRTVFSEFIEIICNINQNNHICIDDSVYNYSLWLRNCAMYLENYQKANAIDDKLIPDVYDGIVNPTAMIQRKLIDINYKCVQKIYPLSDEIAKYALEISMDAYNYLPFVSPEISAHYVEMKKSEEDFTDIGLLTGKAGKDTTISILDSHKSFSSQIEMLIKNLNIQHVVIACGYCFASGLSLLRNVVNKTLFSNIPFELYIGSLQNYDESSTDNLITGIDKSTVKVLNQYLSQSNFQLYTCPDRFYHGKVYIFEGEYETIICLGSSNISSSAFISNYELNVVFKTQTASELHKNFQVWTKQLKHYSKRIDDLDESMFGNNEIKQDGSVLLKHVSLTSMRHRISELSNVEIQYRLNLWMSYSPDTIAEDLGILSLPNYFVFVFRKYGLMVLESFVSGNAYFCISFSDSFENIINTISTLSKTEIFEYSQMTKRGYHVPNKFTLENNIRRYFRKEITR